MASRKEVVTFHLDEASFDKTIQAADRPVLVDFWASRCPPCHALEPIIESVAADARDSAIVAKVNVDQAANLAQRYGIPAIPTMIIFKNGKEADRIVGVHDAANLVERLHSAAA